MNNYRIHVIGCGGIGSYLIPILSKLRSYGQLNYGDKTLHGIFGYDEDEVEQKNLSYQNFTSEDLYAQKVVSLSNRYDIVPVIKTVTSINDLNLSSAYHDLVITAVDNVELRSLIFENEKLLSYWIDPRCNGRFVSIFSKHQKNTLQVMKETLPKQELKESGSCQNQADMKAGIIQLGNQVVATLTAQFVLNYIRGIPNQQSIIMQI